jgi:hypothetical protein
VTRPLTIDAPGTVCAFASRGCTAMVSGRGGFDAHHRWPISLGGPEHPDDLLACCPVHHRRQHSLLRYMIECDTTPPSSTVLLHFTALERETADYAVTQWRAAGSPHIAGWPCPAARP